MVRLPVLVVLLVGVVSRSAAQCPDAVAGELVVNSGDFANKLLVLKNLAVPFSVSLDTNRTADFSVHVVDDAIGNKLTLSGSEISGVLKFRKAKRRSPEADAPGRRKACSPDLPCYGRATVVVSDDSGTCPDATYDLTPEVHIANAPLVPLLVSAIMGPITQDPIITLVAAGWLARSMIEGDAWIGSLRYLDTDLLNTLMGGTFASLLLFTIMIAGVVGGAIKSGGIDAIGHTIGGIVRNSFLGQFAVYCAGFVFFINDYSNTVIVGSSLRVITDTMRLSREKLAFLVDCTASPIASLMPLSTWIGYEVSLIKDEMDAIGYTREAGYTIFLKTIVYRFYSWYMLIFVAVIIFSGRDFGPMYWAEMRARETGVLCVGGEMGKANIIPDDLKPNPRAPKRIINAALPFGLFIILFFPLLYYSGAKQVSWGGVGWNVGSRSIVGNADSWQTLFWTCGMILFVQLIMYACQYSKEWGGCLLKPSAAIEASLAGTNTMWGGLVSLLVALTFAENMKQLLVADYLVDTVRDSLEVQTLPTVVFCLCAVYAFSTGTSWGTMAVFFGPAISLAVYLCQDKGDRPDKSLDTKHEHRDADDRGHPRRRDVGRPLLLCLGHDHPQRDVLGLPALVPLHNPDAPRPRVGRHVHHLRLSARGRGRPAGRLYLYRLSDPVPPRPHDELHPGLGRRCSCLRPRHRHRRGRLPRQLPHPCHEAGDQARR